MGWQGMATTGHLITLMGFFFFFVTLLDSHIERRVLISNNLGIPRFHKRIQYYIFKITYLQYTNKQAIRIPNQKTRQFIINSYFNEYDFYNN
jgi:hypothetical protein